MGAHRRPIVRFATPAKRQSIAMPPPAPDAPTLHVGGQDAICVKWKLPRGMKKNASGFATVSPKADGASSWHRVDAETGKLGEPDALPLLLPSTECVVRGVDPSVQYVAKIRLGDQSGWSRLGSQQWAQACVSMPGRCGRARAGSCG